MTTTPTLRADARNRAARTFIQGLGIDILAAVILLLLPVVTSANGWGDFEWNLLGFLLAKTVAATVFAYVMRTVLDRSSIPTPLPPADPGEPDADIGEAAAGPAGLA